MDLGRWKHRARNLSGPCRRHSKRDPLRQEIQGWSAEITSKAPRVLLLLWTAFLIFISLRWLAIDTVPPAWDEAHHLRLAVQYGQELRSLDLKVAFSPHNFNYPPLYHWTLASALKLFNRVPDSGGYLNCLYLSFLIFSMFELVLFLTKNPWTALAGAAALSSCPFILHMVRFPLIDLALTFWVCFALLCLFRSENFSNRKGSLLLGLAWGLGLMTKWSFFMYMLTPTVWSIVKSRKEDRPNVSRFLIVFAVIVFPWYFPNLFFVLRRMFLSSGGESIDPPVATLAAWLWYPRNFIVIMGGITTALFSVGLLDGIRKKRWQILIGCVLFSYLLWSATHNKDYRYFMPAVPFFVLVGVLWLDKIQARLALPLIALFAAQAWLSSFGWGNNGWPGAYLPRREDWKQSELLKCADDYGRIYERPAMLSTISPTPSLCNISIRYATVQNRIEDRIKIMGNPEPAEYFSMIDFVLDQKSGWDPYSAEYLNHKEIEESRWFKKVYKEIGRWALPHPQDEAVLYAVDPRPGESWSAAEILRALETHPMDPEAKIRDVKIQTVPINAVETSRGHLKSLDLDVGSVEYRGLNLGRTTIRISDLWINIPLLKEKGILKIVRMKSLEPRVQIAAADLERFAGVLGGKYVRDCHVELEEGIIKVSARALNAVNVSVWLRFEADPASNAVRQEFEKIKIGFVTVPRILYRTFTDRFHYLEANPGMLFDLKIDSVRADQGTVRINIP